MVLGADGASAMFALRKDERGCAAAKRLHSLTTSLEALVMQRQPDFPVPSASLYNQTSFIEH